MYQEAEAIWRELSIEIEHAWVGLHLGDLARWRQDFERAERRYDESLRLFRRLDMSLGIAWTLHCLGHLALHLTDLQRASTYFLESLDYFRTKSEATGGKLASLEGLAACVALKGSLRSAALVLGACATLFEQTAQRRAHISPQEYEHFVDSIRMQLGESDFNAAWREGQALTLEQVVEVALRLFTTSRELALTEGSASSLSEAKRPNLSQLSPRTAGMDAPTEPLTSREREVLVLVAQGYTNRQIAQRLYISHKTVEIHVSHILSKLNISSRTQAATWAVKRGIVESTIER